MGAALDNAAVIQHHDGVGVAHGGKAVRDDKHGAPGHQRVHTALHNGLGARVDGAGRLVHNHHRWVGHSRTCNGKQLALTLAEVRAVAVQHGVVAIGQTADEVVRTGQLRRSNALLVTRIQVAVADIFHHRAGEEIGILQDDAQAVTQVRLPDLVDVDAVIADLAVVDVIEAVDQVFPAPVEPTKATFWPGFAYREISCSTIFSGV